MKPLRVIIAVYLILSVGVLIFLSLLWMSPELSLDDFYYLGPGSHVISLVVSLIGLWMVTGLSLYLLMTGRIHKDNIIVFVLGLFGFDTATLTAYAILLHLPQLIWITGLGLWGFFKGPKIKLKGLMAEAEGETNNELSEAAPKPKENESTKRKI